MPFTPVRCWIPRYAKPTSVGDHIKIARSKRRLRQCDVASFIGVSKETIANWEKARTRPPVESMPAIVRFLGYEPMRRPRTLGEQLEAYRMKRGLSIRAAADLIKVDERSWAGWESTGRVTQARHQRVIEAIIETETATPLHDTHEP